MDANNSVNNIQKIVGGSYTPFLTGGTLWTPREGTNERVYGVQPRPVDYNVTVAKKEGGDSVLDLLGGGTVLAGTQVYGYGEGLIEFQADVDVMLIVCE